MGNETQAPTAPPMLRMIIGALVTLLAYGIEPVLAVAVGACFGVWVILGLGSLIRVATDRPSEHHVLVRGAVGHVIVEPEQARPVPVAVPLPPPPPPRRAIPRTKMVECPKCSLLIGPRSAACACGWVVPVAFLDAPPEPVVVPPVAEPTRTDAATARNAGEAPRVCPACPQCRAPTEWMPDFERFFCARCDAYLPSPARA